MNPTVAFVMDEAYFRRFHAEMVESRLSGWRRQRAIGVIFTLVGIAGAVVALGWMRWEASVVAVLMGVFGVWTLRRLAKRRDRWLWYQRRLPIFGARVEVELDGARLVQRADQTNDVVSIPAGEVIESRNGWFVTYEVVHLGTRASDEAVSTEKASAWIPHAFEPAISRDAVAEALGETFVVRRL